MMWCFHSFPNAGFLVSELLLSYQGSDSPSDSDCHPSDFFPLYNSSFRRIQDSCYKWWKIYLLLLLGEFRWFSLRFSSSSFWYLLFLKVCIISRSSFSVLFSICFYCVLICYTFTTPLSLSLSLYVSFCFVFFFLYILFVPQSLFSFVFFCCV